jgi:serine/threonine protein kinase
VQAGKVAPENEEIFVLEPLAPGTVLRARYQIVEIVGQGGMGAVYRAADLVLAGRECAIKEIGPEPGATPDMLAQTRDQFYREASVLARLDHPNLPKVSDYFSEGERDYLVMDFVPGQNLRQLFDEARQRDTFLAEKQVLAWASQLCDALEYLHGQETPILHRDIKPSNIKVTPAGTVKLVDFGLVKLLAPDDSRTITILQGRGTVQYTPLEQYGGDTGHTDVRSDIYSFGATIYHLLCGQPPLDAKQRFLRPGSLKPPRELNPALSSHTEQAILWATALHPDERPASVAELRQALLAPSFRFPTFTFRFTTPKESWRSILLTNLSLIALLVILFITAVIVTARSPEVPLLSATPTAPAAVSTPTAGTP